MFTADTGDEAPGCFQLGLIFVGQTLAVYPACYMICLPWLTASNSFLVRKGGSGEGWAFGEITGFFVVGCALGFLIVSASPGLRWTAVRVGMIPLLLLVLFLTGGHPEELAHYTPAGESGIGIFLFTLPSVSQIGYSVGALLSRFRRQKI